MTRRGSARGFTLSEILVALVLAGIVSIAILMLARGQLRAHEVNDQIMRAQSNARAGIAYVESIVRRGCGGMSSGAIGVNVGNSSGGSVQKLTQCVAAYDGAAVSNGSFTTSTPASLPDALEVIYPISSPTFTTAALTLTSSSQIISVANTNGFATDNLVLVTDNSGGDLFRVQTVTTSTTNAPAGTLTIYSLPSAIGGFTPTGVTLPAGSSVFRAASVSFFLDTALATVPTGYQNTLLYDPDGVAGTTHNDAEPLVENVDDFQVAFGVDGYNGGTIDGLISEGTGVSNNEWVGDATGEIANMGTTVPTPWVSTGIHPLMVRATMRVRTGDKYLGSVPTANLTFEDRSPPTVASPAPKYRPERIVVAPRAWNLTN